MQPDYNKVNELLFRLLDNEINDSDFETLRNWLNSSREAKLYYYRFMEDCSALSLRKMTIIAEDHQDSQFNIDLGTDSNVPLEGVDAQDILSGKKEAAVADYDDSVNRAPMEAMHQLAEREKSAAGIEIPKEEPHRELIQKVVYLPRQKNRLSQFQRFTLAACAVGVIFFVLFVKFAPVPSDLPLVAELVDQIGAVWDEDMQLPDYDGGMRQSTYRLTAGYASILFDSGAKITVAAPAEWSLLGGGNMELFRGRIYAVVPEEAHGFTVMAGSSKIVDLGTEFGVEVDDKNNTQLHVIKGKTLLFSGFKTGKKLSIQVDEGSAKKVSSDGLVKDIPLENCQFVRSINSKYDLVWKGQQLAQGGLLSGLPDVTVVDGAITSLTFDGTVYVVADGDLVVGTTTRWDNGIQVVDPDPPAVNIGANADNFLFEANGDTNISSLDGLDYQETVFSSPVSTIFVFERGSNFNGTNGTVQAIITIARMPLAMF
ncbi:MAG: FecR domain-containing protein [Deltaproteobacteria bacterium]|nr:FecR domain-containing protein [Deltaproteobacteria bacterium]